MATGQFIVVQNSLSFNQQQVIVTIDRDRAAALNLSIRDIGTTLGLLVSDGAIAQFDRESNSYDIIVQVPQRFRNNPEKLGEFFVRSVTGEMVPLSAVVNISTDVTASAIEQFDQLNSSTLSAMPMLGVTTGTALQTLVDIAREEMPDGFFSSTIPVSRGSRLRKAIRSPSPLCWRLR